MGKSLHDYNMRLCSLTQFIQSQNLRTRHRTRGWRLIRSRTRRHRSDFPHSEFLLTLKTSSIHRLSCSSILEPSSCFCGISRQIKGSAMAPVYVDTYRLSESWRSDSVRIASRRATVDSSHFRLFRVSWSENCRRLYVASSPRFIFGSQWP